MRLIHLPLKAVMGIGRVIAIITVVLSSCKKEQRHLPIIPSRNSRHILLKDIIESHLPSPYYHFEYNSDSLVTHVDFGSEYTRYDVVYSSGRISEMRNNIIVNHDTLRYAYDNMGKVAMIGFINGANIMYRHVFFAYENGQIKQIQWDRKEGDIGFIIDRTLSFTYYTDGNVKTITEHRPPVNGSTDYTSVKTFDAYDNQVNVDDFSLIHDGIHDHLFLLQGFRLQKNNPKKEKLSVNGTDYYTIDYNYTYNPDSTPSNKAGDFLYLSGQYEGQRFQINTSYSYY